MDPTETGFVAADLPAAGTSGSASSRTQPREEARQVIRFLAHLLEQLDFALDHLSQEDLNYQRVSLMLIDNVVELALHCHAEGKLSDNRLFGLGEPPPHDPKLVAEALKQHFEAKVKLATATGLLDDKTAGTVTALHTFRNQLHHRGIVHEHILPALSLFYFRTTCDVLLKFELRGYSWSSTERMPLRAIKYIGKNPMPKARELFPVAWARLKEASESIQLRLVDALAEHMKEAIDETDRLIDYLATGGPEKMSRDGVVLDSQAWGIAFEEEGRKYAREHACPATTVAAIVDWIGANYPGLIRSDPIPSWRRRLAGLEQENDEHLALRKYTEFMTQSEGLRDRIQRSAGLLDAYIDEQVERSLLEKAGVIGERRGPGIAGG